ncbi:MAG TPA: ABC transporter substrate-binding protein [Candidatus Binatia bacterium]|jgi:NitT/TauT family transport system substrate-binding protein
MRFRKNAPLAFAIASSMIIAGLFPARTAWPAEPAPKKVIVAYTSFAPSALRFLLEKELGYFREEGIIPEFVLVRGGSIAVKGMIAGNFDYIITGGPVVDAVIRARQPLKLIFTAEMASFWLVAQPDIRSIADLKGKTVGINTFGGASEFTMREILRRHGLDPVKDMTFLVVGASSDRFNALVAGTVHSTLATPPGNFKAVQMGYRKLASATDYVKWPQAGLGTSEEKIRRDPEEVMKMVRASSKGLKLMLAQREYIVAKMMQMFRLSRDDAVQTYESTRDALLPSGHLNEDQERAVISLGKQVADVTEDIPPERVFENRFIKQAEQELKGWAPQAPR